MMNTLVSIALGVVILVLAVTMLSMRDHWRWLGHRRRYRHTQADRAAMPDESFCSRAGLDPSAAGVVSTIRSKIAEVGRYDPLRIYPEDSLSPQFRLDHDDDVATTIQEMNIIRGYEEYSFPLEEVHSVADFARVVLRLKREAEAGE